MPPLTFAPTDVAAALVDRRTVLNQRELIRRGLAPVLEPAINPETSKFSPAGMYRAIRKVRTEISEVRDWQLVEAVKEFVGGFGDYQWFKAAYIRGEKDKINLRDQNDFLEDELERLKARVKHLEIARKAQIDFMKKQATEQQAASIGQHPAFSADNEVQALQDELARREEWSETESNHIIKVQKLEQMINGLEKEKEQWEIDEGNWRHEIEELEKRVKKLEEVEMQQRMELGRLRRAQGTNNEVSTSVQPSETLQDELTRYREHSKVLHRQLEGEGKAKETLKNHIDALDDENEKLKAEPNRFKKGKYPVSETETLQEELRTCKKHGAALERELQDSQSIAAQFEADNTTLQRLLNDTEEISDSLTARTSTLQTQNAALQDRISTFGEEKTKMDAEVDRLNAENERLMKAMDQTGRRNFTLRKQQERAQSKPEQADVSTQTEGPERSWAGMQTQGPAYSDASTQTGPQEDEDAFQDAPEYPQISDVCKRRCEKLRVLFAAEQAAHTHTKSLFRDVRLRVGSSELSSQQPPRSPADEGSVQFNHEINDEPEQQHYRQVLEDERADHAHTKDELKRVSRLYKELRRVYDKLVDRDNESHEEVEGWQLRLRGMREMIDEHIANRGR